MALRNAKTPGWLLLALLSGCGAAATSEAPAPATAASVAPRQTFTAGTASPGPVQTACVSGSVFFGVDSAALDDAAREQLECISRSSARLNIVGMADPRGTEEYNLALGDRRARAVAEHISRLGYDRSRIDTRSLGEESANGTTESDWARDRRANFVAE
jgi:peptidoglycan-associated lipoprotein